MENDKLPDFIPQSTVAFHKAADVTAAIDESKAVITQTFPVKQSEESWNDYQIGVWARVLRRCRSRLNAICEQRFPWEELLLAMASLTLGGTVSAVLSGTNLDSDLGVLFFVILPPIASGCLVGYLMLRVTNIRNSKQLAEDILGDLPDPDRTT